MTETTFTEPRYDPAELRQMFKEAGAEDLCPQLLLPLPLLLPILKRRIGPVGKSGEMKPKQGTDGPRYAFRRIEDILNEGHGPLCDLGIGWRKVAVARHELTANGKAQQCVMDIEYELWGPLGDTVRTVATGQAVDFGSDKSTNKADTAARKNMLVDLLQLATEDPDEERPERVDERPHVQRASQAQVAEVGMTIKALPDADKERVKAWTDEHGMVVTAAGLTVGDYQKLKAYLKATAPKEGAAPPAPPALQAPPAAPPAAPEAPTQAAEGGPCSDEAWNTLKGVLGKLTDDQRAALGATATGLGLPKLAEGKLARAEITEAAYGEVMKVVSAIKRGSAAATKAVAKKAPAKKAAGRRTASRGPDPDELRAGVRRELKAQVEAFSGPAQEAVGAAIEKATGGFGPWSEVFDQVPAADDWDRWLSDVIKEVAAADADTASAEYGDPETTDEVDY